MTTLSQNSRTNLEAVYLVSNITIEILFSAKTKHGCKVTIFLLRYEGKEIFKNNFQILLDRGGSMNKMAGITTL